ncbi:hypothetical protein TNCV_2285371 [Trichonephila clavipes]|nr:hypothetical protein TNCV_2285371 [Trichonephila clavipes]
MVSIFTEYEPNKHVWNVQGKRVAVRLSLPLTVMDTYEIQVEEQRHTIETKEYRHFLQMMIPAYNKKGWAAFHWRRESIAGESSTFPEENITMPYSVFEPEPTPLPAEGHIHHSD